MQIIRRTAEDKHACCFPFSKLYLPDALLLIICIRVYELVGNLSKNIKIKFFDLPSSYKLQSKIF